MAKSQDNIVEMERRAKEERRNTGDRRQGEQAVAFERRTTERRKAPRRRQIDPTTCERDYTNDEIEFMQALDDYKRRSGRMFPTCSEILEVIRSLGYQRPCDADVAEPGEELGEEPDFSETADLEADDNELE